MNVSGIRITNEAGGLKRTMCERCCGTCKYGSYDKTDGYVCVNDQSEYVADFVELDHSCDEYVEGELEDCE